MNSPAVSEGRLPSWLKVKFPHGENYERIKAVSARRRLHTVCEEAHCPNIAECWGGRLPNDSGSGTSSGYPSVGDMGTRGTATFMVMGDTCTRGCRFCSVSASAAPEPLDPEEPNNLAETLFEMDLDYAVITSVCRDDLADQGARHLARCVSAVKERCPKMLLEVLIPDFREDKDLLRLVVDSGPDVISHNLETVERLTPSVRDAKAGYRQSLDVLNACLQMAPNRRTKSSLMLGLGETREELLAAFEDLRSAGVSILTLGQYLRPAASKRHLPVAEFIAPERFEQLGRLARERGFLYVASGPFVRSSYRAGELFLKGILEEKNALVDRI